MRRLLCAALFLLTAPLAGQTAAPVSRAAATITSADVARRVGVIADDSMMGRDTPSRGLDLTARYVAEEFRKFGLRPGGDSSYLQFYPITRRRLDPEKSRVVFTVGEVRQTAGFTTSARHDGGAVPEKAVRAGAVLVGGAQTAESAGRIELAEKVVLYSPPARVDQNTLHQVVRVLFLAQPKALLILSDKDSATFARAIPKRAPERTVVGLPTRQPVVVQVRAGAVSHALAAAGVDLTEVRAATVPVFKPLDRLTVEVDLKDTTISSLKAPNTVGILEGSDPVLKNQHIVYSAHMDHIGITPGKPDSINNGADDDASGTTGVIELAEAFSRPGARPKRSIIFLTVSGEEKGLWGSDHFASHPPVPIGQIVANINIDMIGRNWPDTIVAIGKEHSDLGATLNRVNAAHPELRMTAIDDRWPEERFYFRSDHYNFARKGVPVLFFFNGVHEDYHEVTDSPDRINSEKEARILRLLYYLGQEIGNSPNRPTWNPESRREIVEEKGVSRR
ncbi:MAG TPA: M28 family peptidase [Gemmatimonadales bacterium]